MFEFLETNRISELELEVSYRLGPHVYKGVLTRPLTELEQLRKEVADLRSRLSIDNPSLDEN